MAGGSRSWDDDKSDVFEPPGAPIEDDESSTDPGKDELDTQLVDIRARSEADSTLAQPTSRAAEIGEQIGRYRLDGLLGEGGGGSVYLATRQDDGRAVALKVLATRLAGDAEYVSRFFHEARIVREINHPNIVEILEFIVTENPRRVAYAMELVEGVPLSQLLVLRKLSMREAVTITMQLAHALETVHKLDVIHRDLKPENVLVEGYDDPGKVLTVKILDFGVAKFGSDVGHQTRTGAMLGTPRYMAPEQLFDEPITPKADVYALGEIFYETLTGRRVFEGENRSVMQAKSLDSPALGLAIPDDLPGAAQIMNLLLASLAQSPAKRPTVKDFWGRLVGIMSALPASELEGLPVPEAPRSSWIPTRGKEGVPPLVHGSKSLVEPVAGPETLTESEAKPVADEPKPVEKGRRAGLSPRVKRVLAATLLLVPTVAVAGYATATDEAKQRAAGWLGRVSVVLTSEPAGAAFDIDGVEACKAGRPSCRVTVSRGLHRVRARLGFHEPLERTVDLGAQKPLGFELVATYGELEITSAPPGLIFSIDEVVSGRTPARVPVEPGEHAVAISSPCHAPASKTVLAERGQKRLVELTAPEKRASIKLNALGPKHEPVPAEIWLDGQRVGTTPAKLDVSVCALRLELRHGSLGTFKKTLKLEPGTTTSVEPVLGDEVLVPQGEFVMGCDRGGSATCEDDEQPAHVIFLESFLIDRTEVSVSAFRSCVDSGVCSASKVTGFEWKDQPFMVSDTCNFGQPGKSSHPMNCVSFLQAESYCRFKKRRLPTEAEWEKAARGPDKRTFPWGNEPPTCDRVVMRFPGTPCSQGTTRPVASDPLGAGPYGNLHLGGNVAEWTSDFYEERFYSRSPPNNPTGPQAGTVRVTRGGHFGVRDLDGVPVTDRSGRGPEDRFDTLGFRCARSATVAL
ncbi:MAG: SUMF1/EgtB/PvdO family nonheme iron enzyme [Deltaproteobacteria bacterium]|nr:SUMF1/EgtB/PvdO family nonheme iron enzyme [Deltaproteobacteria bacterium]